jgi:hypothetical protein
VNPANSTSNSLPLKEGTLLVSSIPNQPGAVPPTSDDLSGSSPSAPNDRPPKRLRRWLVIPLLLIVIPGGIYGFNYLTLQNQMNEVLKSDPRNKGVEVSVHYQTYINPSVLVYDLRGLSGTNSKVDVFRSFLQFAEKLKDKKFEKVELAFRGETRFVLDGDYFQGLGREYATQNPVWTMNHFPENLRLPDGTLAYGTWTGGWLGVAGKQIEDFNDVHDKWYMRDILKDLQ